MTTEPNVPSATGDNVLEYYARNWESIANCYALDEKGLPIDPAWYRRRLYNEFLRRHRPGSILDIGCGGGWTVLDALDLGLDARGIEPVAELKAHGCALLGAHAHDPSRIEQGDLAKLATLPSDSVDCIALLSVLPLVPRESWDDVHEDIARVLRPGGRLITAYRNQLFDLYTFNSFTMEFYDRELWGCEPCGPLRTDQQLARLKGLVVNPDVPGPYFTVSTDKSFGHFDRQKSNPLTMPAYLAGRGLRVERTSFYHFHCVPPLLADAVDTYRTINHQLELTMADDWRGTFMAAMFVVDATRA